MTFGGALGEFFFLQQGPLYFLPIHLRPICETQFFYQVKMNCVFTPQMEMPFKYFRNRIKVRITHCSISGCSFMTIFLSLYTADFPYSF